MPPNGDLVLNSGMCPDWESNLSRCPHFKFVLFSVTKFAVRFYSRNISIRKLIQHAAHHTGSQQEWKDSVLGLMVCCYFVKILNSF